MKRKSNAKVNCIYSCDIRFLFFLLLIQVSTNRLSILEPQWHLGAALA